MLRCEDESAREGGKTQRHKPSQHEEEKKGEQRGEEYFV